MVNNPLCGGSSSRSRIIWALSCRSRVDGAVFRRLSFCLTVPVDQNVRLCELFAYRRHRLAVRGGQCQRLDIDAGVSMDERPEIITQHIDTSHLEKNYNIKFDLRALVN